MRRKHTTDVLELRSRERCKVAGILNVTPDSFSDGGLYSETRRAVAHGLEMIAAGADFVDVGGESTRPGAVRVGVNEELRRIIPVIVQLVDAGAVVSVDTTRATVADAALAAGASIINDVSGGSADEAMASVVASAGVPWVLTHWRGPSRTMAGAAHYTDVIAEVRAELLARVETALAAGVASEQLVLDPGLGFAKRPEHDLALLAGLQRIVDLGFPVLVGASRKSFIGSVLAGSENPRDRAVDRDSATVATTALAAHAGAWAVRVHDVSSNVDAVRLVAAMRSSTM
ncbi:dihydropteroate synthase [Rhodococcus sp. T2V]|uniref:dihydropteroate synthase n=1 Tax=Rhodococcus sp. T2V TaxID=3034164 RepID=UPI0023E0C989|nr:dihydropteroate synthase [Rhodococcus sp. T2V]MDF3311138.1 dihydropteroate synthase [Rhodococcus sp. T2V]